MLEIHSLSKAFIEGEKSLQVLSNISLKINRGEFVALVGPSGCGKSTLLRCIARLIQPTAGEIIFQQLEGEAIEPYRPKISMVFQRFSAFPWLTVRENIGFGLKIGNVFSKSKTEIVNHYLGATGLKAFAESYPKELSVGMRQRVAIAMALATDPALVLMDEPFSALDTQTRSLMQELLLDIWDNKKTTIVFVTHDIEEAIFLADRVFVMSTLPGTIKEEILVTLKRPRTNEIKLSDEFLRIRRHIHYLIRGESIKAAQFKFPEANPKAVTIGLHTWVGVAPFYYAQEYGHFAKRDLNVELVGLEKDEDRIRAFKDGEVDLLALPADSLFYLRDIEHIDCEIVMVYDTSYGADALVARKGINSIRELRGKKVGVEEGLFPHFFLAKLLIKNGLDLDAVNIVFLRGSNIGAALLKEEIDAAVLWEPWLSSVLQVTHANVLVSTREEQDTIIDVLFARRDFARDHQNEIQKIIWAWGEVVSLLPINPLDSAQKVAPYLGLSRDEYLSQIEKVRFIEGRGQKLYFQKVERLLEENKKIWNLIKEKGIFPHNINETTRSDE